MKELIIAGLALLALSGCSIRMLDLTVASTKNYNLNSNQFEKGERVKAVHAVPVVIIPLGHVNIKTAVDRAIEQNPCAVALADVVVTTLNQSFFFGRVGYRVEGNLILDRAQPNCQK